MKVSDLAKIPEPYSRFVQSMKFLRSLKDAEAMAAEIRDRTLLELRDPSDIDRPTQTDIAEEVGVSPQRISLLENQAKQRYGK